jgi:AcrR family transcriptional regulator
MPRTAEANAHRRDEQRVNLLNAARKVFLRQGRAMTMADIAVEAKVSQGLAYRYFANKEAIFHALIEQAIQDDPAGLRRFLEMAGTPLERLTRLVSQLIESRRTHPEFVQLFDQVRSAETMPDDLRERVRERSHVFLHVLRQLIEEAQQAGEVTEDNPEQLLIVLTACLEGLTRWAVCDPEQFHQHAPSAEMVLRLLQKPSDQR